MNRRAYLAVRVVLFFIVLVVAIWALQWAASNGRLRCFLFYTTNQGLIIETTYLAFAAFTTYKASRVDLIHGAVTPWYAKATWILQDLVFPLSFLIFFLYWITIYGGGTPHLLTMCTHGLNFFVMVVDQVLTLQPVRLSHGLYFFAYACCYIIWTGVHHGARLGNCSGDRYIYSTLNWRRRDHAAAYAFIILLVVSPLLIVIFWLCCKRRALRADDQRHRSSDDLETELVPRDEPC